MLISSRQIEEQNDFSNFKRNQGYRSFQSVLDFADDLNDLIQENENLKAEIYYLQREVEYYRSAYDDLAAIGQQGCFDILNTLLSDD